jgi:hypothetical protein
MRAAVVSLTGSESLRLEPGAPDASLLTSTRHVACDPPSGQVIAQLTSIRGLAQPEPASYWVRARRPAPDGSLTIRVGNDATLNEKVVDQLPQTETSAACALK